MQTRKYIYLIFILEILWQIFYWKQTVEGVAVKEKDCVVYNVDTNKFMNVSHVHIIGEDLQVGFLRSDTTQPPKGVQLYFYQDQHRSKKLTEIFINENSSVSAFQKGIYKKMSEAPLPPLNSSPAWYFLIIRMHHNKKKQFLKITILRPEEIVPIASWTVKDQINPLKFIALSITSKHQSQVVFNCLTGCPLFRPDYTISHQLRLSLFHTINVRLMLPSEKYNEKESLFKYSLQVNQFNQSGLGEKHESTISKAGLLRIKIERVQENSTVCVDFEYGNFKECGDRVFLTVLENKNFFWTLQCEHHFKKNLSNRDGRELEYEAGKKSKEKLTLGQVIAWIISAIALCGVIILALRLYYNIKGVSKDKDGMEGEIAFPSIMMSEYDVFTPESKDNATDGHISYIDASKGRIPEEATQPRESFIDTANILPYEQLYPLKVLSDDEASVEDGFSSLKSTATVTTIVHCSDPEGRS